MRELKLQGGSWREEGAGEREGVELVGLEFIGGWCVGLSLSFLSFQRSCSAFSDLICI